MNVTTFLGRICIVEYDIINYTWTQYGTHIFLTVINSPIILVHTVAVSRVSLQEAGNDPKLYTQLFSFNR